MSGDFFTQAEAAIDHERLTSLIGSMADGVIAVDDKSKVVLYNGAALNILDKNSNMKGRPLHNLLHLRDRNGQIVDIRSLIAAAVTPTTSRDYLLHYKDGSTINVYLSIAPVHLGYGATGDRGYVILLRDITREKSLEEERDEFISVVSHELRTPIAIAEGHLSNAKLLAERGHDIRTITEAISVAHGQILFLADMINDLATLSRAERGVLTLDIATIDPVQLVKDLAASYNAEAAAKGLAFDVIVPSTLAPLSSGVLYVREILQNFITNALKYTQEGSITLKAEAADNATRFIVQDTGIGISKSDRERVFDKFFRSEDYRTRASGGTGLGLYVTMKLARLLHATITLDSMLNRGSTFTITVPNLSTTAPRPASTK